MNRKWIVLVSLAIGLVLPARAQNLLFTNTSSGASSNFTTLDAISYGGGSNFVVVGSSSNALIGTFSGNGSTLGNEFTWTTTQISSQASNIFATTFGGNPNIGFVAGGQFARDFTSPNGVNWTLQSNAFASPFQITGLAYSSGGSTFAAIGAGPVASWADAGIASWHAAIITNPLPVFVESYNGITALGANSFVLCGARGTIRISTDAGHTWVQAGTNKFASTEPDYLGIVASGNTIVCVGTNATTGQGAVMVSTDGGNNWVKVSAGVPTNALYALTHTGSEFLAVGSAGMILASANGSSWHQIGAGASTKSLFGVAFATNGPLQGLALTSGAGGAVVLAGEQPPAPINPVSTNNCAFPNPTKPISVSLTGTVFSPVGALTVDWYDAPSGGNLMTNNSLQFFAPNTSAGIYTYYAQTRDMRTGFTSTSRVPATLTVDPLPTATIASFTSVDFCSGTNSTINVALTGNGPWTVTWSDGFAEVTGTASYARNVHPTTTPLVTYVTNYFITALTDAKCTAIPSGLTGMVTLTVTPRPTATITSFTSTDFCSGTNSTINAPLTGTAPWTVTWSDGFTEVTGTASYTRNVHPTTTPLVTYVTNYSIIALSDANCKAVSASNDLTGVVTLTVTPRPTATITSFTSTDFCSGTNSTIQAPLTGTAPWTVTWSDGLVEANVTTNNYTRNVHPTTTPLVTYVTNYSIIALSDANCKAVSASNDLTGVVTLTVTPRPTATITSFTSTDFCSGTNSTIQAPLTGTAPWTVTWSDGLVEANITTNNYSRNVHPTTTPLVSYATNYSIIALSDANCRAVTASNDLTGSVILIVTPRPTAAVVNFNSTDFCSGTTDTLTVNLTGTQPWKITWSDGVTENGVVASNHTRNVTPINTGLPAYPTNYYITALSDANCIALASDLTGTNSLVVTPLPTATISGNNTICNGDTALVVTTLGGSAGPWQVSYSVTSSAGGTTNFTQTNSTSPFTNSFVLAYGGTNSVTNTYAITSVTDTLTGCVATGGGLPALPVTIIVHAQAPMPSNAVAAVTCPGFTPYPPLSVSVPAGISVNWYDANGILVATGTNAFAPVGPAIPTNTMASNFIFYAESVAGTGCTNTNRLPVTLTVKDCSTPLSIQLVATNVVLNWPGDRDLQITNALPVGTNTNGWVTIQTGVFGGTNSWTNGIGGFGNYFRLYPFP